MTTIVDFFDPHDINHVAAWKALEETGAWPQGFIPEGTVMSEGWHRSLSYKMADAWVEHKLANRAVPSIQQTAYRALDAAAKMSEHGLGTLKAVAHQAAAEGRAMINGHGDQAKPIYRAVAASAAFSEARLKTLKAVVATRFAKTDKGDDETS